MGAVAAEGAAQGVRMVRKRDTTGVREALEERGHCAKVRLCVWLVEVKVVPISGWRLFEKMQQ